MIGSAELAARPRLKASDLIEAVPGVATTEHSTGGHAPIVLLQGLQPRPRDRLRHLTRAGADESAQPRPCPGLHRSEFPHRGARHQGGVPEGSLLPRTGNFGTAGSVNLELADTVDEPYARLEAGGNGFLRLLGVASFERGRHRLLVAAEANHDNGPSDIPDDYSRSRRSSATRLVLRTVVTASRSRPSVRRGVPPTATLGGRSSRTTSRGSARSTEPRRALAAGPLLSATRRRLTPDSLVTPAPMFAITTSTCFRISPSGR